VLHSLGPLCHSAEPRSNFDADLRPSENSSLIAPRPKGRQSRSLNSTPKSRVPEEGHDSLADRSKGGEQS
jgi:hypothetical protein